MSPHPTCSPDINEAWVNAAHQVLEERFEGVAVKLAELEFE
jgi:hypothetical protein